MQKAFRIMLSAILAYLLFMSMMSTALAVDVTDNDSSLLNGQPTGQQYYPDYDEEPAQQEVEFEPAPASPKTGDNDMTVMVLLMAAAACVTLGASHKALHA